MSGRSGAFLLAWTSRYAIHVVVTLGIVTAVARAVAFCVFPGLPWFYVKDLGIHFITTEYIRNNVHSLADFHDLLGWSLWWDQPFFFLNGYVSYLLTVPLSVLVGSTWEAIKLLEVLALIGAGLGIFWLMRLARRPRIWAATAGLLYASAPLVTFAPRGNLDFAIPVTILPAALAFGITMIRRFRLRALPIIGIVCSLVGATAALEFAAFVTLPAYLVLAAYAYDSRARLRWLLATVAGGFTALALPAYYLLPTFYGNVFSPLAARSATLESASFSTEFSEGILELAALVPREALLSPQSIYNASAYLPIALVGGMLVWTFAVIGAANGGPAYRKPAVVVAGFLCATFTVMSACATFGWGQTFWQLMGHVPLINEIRTPDRFLTFVVPFVACAAADGLAVLFALQRQRLASALLLALACGSLFYFAANTHVWENQQDYGYVEPDLARVNRTVASIGPRTVSFAVPNGGSPLDAASYGVPIPVTSNYYEFTSRYLMRGYMGMGILRRAGVRSVVTSPQWNDVDTAGLPNFDVLLSNVPFAPTVLRSGGGITVRRLQGADSAISGVAIGCVRGGPGLLDLLAFEPRLRHTAFVAGNCSPAVDTNSDESTTLSPRDVSVQIAGKTLCPQCSTLRDVDENFSLQRYSLKNAWYRNSVDGDAVTFSRSAVAQIVGRTILHVSGAGSGTSDLLLVRGAAHAYVYLDIVFANGAQHSIRLLPGRGLHAVAVPIPAPARGSDLDISVRVDGNDIEDFGYHWTGYGLDGVAFTSARAYERAQRSGAPPIVAAFDVLHYAPVIDRTYASEGFVFDGSGRDDRRWRGRSGRYVVELRTAAAGRFAFALRRNGRVVSLADPNGDGRSSVRSVSIRTGERFGATAFDLLLKRPVAIAANITRIAARIPFASAAIGEEVATADFTDPASALSMVDDSSGRPGKVTENGYAGSKGSSLRFFFAARAGANVNLTLRGVRGPGFATVQLYCGAIRYTANVSAAGSNSLDMYDAPRCAGTIRWEGDLVIGRIVIKAFEPQTALNVWLPAGKFRIAFRTDSGLVRPSSAFTLDGRRLSANTIFNREPGRHELVVTGELGVITLFGSGSTAFPGIEVTPRAAIRYSIEMHSPGALKLTQLNDANWILQSGDKRYAGETCDLIDTCFEPLPAGRYELQHRYDRSLRIGFLLSLLALFIAFAPLAKVPGLTSPGLVTPRLNL